MPFTYTPLRFIPPPPEPISATIWTVVQVAAQLFGLFGGGKKKRVHINTFTDSKERALWRSGTTAWDSRNPHQDEDVFNTRQFKEWQRADKPAWYEFLPSEFTFTYNSSLHADWRDDFKPKWTNVVDHAKARLADRTYYEDQRAQDVLDQEVRYQKQLGVQRREATELRNKQKVTAHSDRRSSYTAGRVDAYYDDLARQSPSYAAHYERQTAPSAAAFYNHQFDERYPSPELEEVS